MKRVRVNFLLKCLAFGVLAVASMPSKANAQTVGGKFSLSSEAHWGTLTLPKGEYTFTVSSFGGASMVEIQKEGMPSQTRFIGVEGRDLLSDASKSSRLVLERVDGELYVKKLELASIGMVYYYAPPTSKELLLSKNSSRGERIAPSGK